MTPRLMHRPRRGAGVALGVAILCALPILSATPRFVLNARLAATNACGPPVVNPVACENTLPGTPQDVWDVGTSTDTTILGFATDMSVNVGQTVHFKINTDAKNYTIDIYRVGYYQGNGARHIASVTPSVLLPQSQPACLTDSSTGLVDCGNWAESASWDVPASAVSGVYLALLTRPDTLGQSQIVFVVRNDASHSDILFQTSDSSWQAYNTYGGNSLYSGTAPAGRAYKVSYNRPVTTRNYSLSDQFFYAEFAAAQFLEQNGYDVSYFSGVDSARSGTLIENHKVFLTAGHDEYWSGPQRANVQAARDAGVNLAFMSGNEVFWKTRWESSIDGSNQPYRTMVTYKETHANAVIDPADPPTWTGTWRDPRFSPPADGGQAENALTGQLWTVNEGTTAIQVPASYAPLRFWRNTSVASLTGSQVATLAGDTLGYEWDEEPDNGFRPAGLFDLSSTTVSGVARLTDYGTNVVTGTATHNMSLYRAPSGALVFGAGTVQWVWGLTANHDGLSPGDTFDVRIQQATINLFADMGAQPATLMSGMVAATKSTDLTPPSSTITSPAPGTALASGQTVTVTGTAHDTGGGTVASVEVSTDNGTTWHRAVGRTSWTYAWQAGGAGNVVIKSRAVDDSANLETPSAGVQIIVNCPCSIWNTNTVPAETASTDGSPIEVGVKFRTDVNATVTGVRFYKGAGNTGSHVGNLWTATGQLLASVSFTGETASGWQQANFASPVTISQNVTYVVSYFAPVGHYADTTEYFYPPLSPPPTGGSVVDNGPIHALRNGVSGSNGVFSYSTTSAFPNSSFGAANYWVDVLYTPITGVSSQPPVVTSVSPPDSSSNVPVSAPVAATFNESIDPATLVMILTDPLGASVPASVTYDDPSRTATLQPTAPLAPGVPYSAAVQASDLAGNRMTSPTMWSFLTAGTRQCTCTIFFGSQAPQTASVSDSDSVNLGVKFRTDMAGLITGIRFYKGAGNTGTHVGSLWSASGTLLATATFGNETASGWQDVGFSSPVAVAAQTTYVASYLAPAGHYAITPAGFANKGIDSPPLHALASGVDGLNGVYAYSAVSAFPTGSYNSTDYWVDAVFEQTPTTSSAPTILSQSPAAGATGVAVTDVVTAKFSGPVTNASIAVHVPGGSTVPGTVFYDPVSHIATFVSAHGLPYGTAFSASASATDLSGTPMPSPTTWTFSTGAPACPCSIWAPTAVPSIVDAGDGSSLELGVKFRADADGFITGVRFYKALANTGTHIGNLWTASGQLLATGTFSGETASGWQQLTFASPVPVSANTSYVASYFAPAGHFSSDPLGFTQAGVDSPPLHALGNGVDGGNGLFYYGPSSTFPTFSLGSNYWVDVVYTVSGAPDTNPPVVTAETPAPGSTDVPVGSTLTVTFNKPVLTSSLSLTLTGPSGPVGGTVSYNQVTRTATLTPSAPLALSASHTASVTASDSFGHTMASPFTWSFTTTSPACPCTIWPSAATPASADAGDGSAIELGVKFRADSNGVATGIRFYKSAANTGTHLGNLWSSTGTLLASAVFSGETASGWQQVTFSGAVPITAGTTYIASYFAPTGHYASTPGAFTGSGVDSPPLHALADGASGGNGVFHYGSTSTFPTNTVNAANYWVDVVYASSGAVDTDPPAVSVTGPASGASGVATGAAVTATFSEAVTSSSITFSLTPSAGSAVAGALSYDLTSRTATFVPTGGLVPGTTYTAAASASDLYGNAMASAFTWSFTTETPTCPCTIWPSTAAPASPDAGDGSAIELGVKFRSDSSGVITGIRFYKAAANTGTHIGNLWSSTGTLLASAVFSGETASGWQQVTFSGAVPVTAGTTYVASYFAPTGHHAATPGTFTSGGVDNSPLHALPDGSGGGNGVFHYGSASTFPTASINAANYWVDVVFALSGATDTTPPTVSATSPGSGATGVPTGASPTVTFGEAVAPSTIAFTLTPSGGSAVAASVSYDLTSRTAILVPAAGLSPGTTYTATISASDLYGNAMASPVTWSFATQPFTCPCTLWPNSVTPPSPDSGDGASIEVGVKFNSDIAGYISGVRFYKSTANTGTHIGNLWTASGQLLATATFTGESASGWQQVSFSSPVPVAANTTYIASYFAPAGHFASSAGAFSSSGFDTPPLHALASGVAGGNGVFQYANSSTFPASALSSNYWVDVVFLSAGTPDTSPPTITSQSPAPNSSGAPVTTTVTFTFNEPVQQSSVVFQLSRNGGGSVAGALSYDQVSRTGTFTPSSSLSPSTAYSASVSATDPFGHAMTSPVAWSFTTAAPNCPCSIWSSSAAPLQADSGDGSSIEVGLKFQADVAGYVTGVRFYESSANTGTHIGNLWTSTGTLLATVTFSGETSSGWQLANFSTPVAISAGTTYVISYFTSTGHYSSTPGAFSTSGVDNPPLHALAEGVSGGDGVFTYGSTSAFPSSSHNSTNYWVDVIFTTSSP
jgi:methionine-rich copper-binding protein CopC